MSRIETDEAQAGRVNMGERSFAGLIWTVQATWIGLLIYGGSSLAVSAFRMMRPD